MLTQYFYSELRAFERNPESLNEAIGPMVYGMDISVETHRARNIAFDAHGEGEVMSHGGMMLPPEAKRAGCGGVETDEGRRCGRGGYGAEGPRQPQRRCGAG